MNLGREPFLSGEIEAALTVDARDGDAEAHRRLVTSALPWVIRIAKEYREFGVPFEDLVQEGVLGLLEAVRRFDPTRGNRLLTYAAPWIRKTIRQALDRQGNVVRPSTYASRRKSGAEHPTIRIRCVPLEGTIGPDGRNSPASRLADGNARPDEHLVREEGHRLVRCGVASLEDRERRILTRRFGLDGRPSESLDAVGTWLGISRERVRQIEGTALDKLRRGFSRGRRDLRASRSQAQKKGDAGSGVP